MNIGSLFRDNALVTPAKPAVTCTERTFTFGQLDDRANRVAHALRQLGVGPGDRVTLHLPNGAEMVEALFGVHRLGAIANPVNVMASPDEMAYIIGDCRPTVLLTTSFLHPNVSAALAQQGEYQPVIVAAGEPRPAGVVGYEALVAHARSEPVEYEAGEDAPCSLLYTSGTTGRPKGAMLSHGNILANVRVAIAVDAGRPDDVTLNPGLPLFHMYAAFWLYASLFSGATHVLQPYFMPAEVFDAITRHRVTAMAAVPTILRRLLADPGIASCDFSRVRACACGADALSADVQRQWEATTGTPIIEGYGMTETAPLITINPLRGRRKPGTVGPASGCQVRVVDDDDRDVPTGATGEVVTRGPNVMLGYWDQPEATADVMRGGWLHTGDIGRLDDDGYLTIVDRKKDLIITGGANIYPAEVERVLYQHDAVAICAVVGVPDAKLASARALTSCCATTTTPHPTNCWTIAANTWPSTRCRAASRYAHICRWDRPARS